MTSPNIVLIVTDTLRYDKAFPSEQNTKLGKTLHALGNYTVYSNAFSNSPWTLPAHTSMFTGLSPDQHMVSHNTPILAKQIPTISELLHNRGYQTLAVCENDAWINKMTGLTRGFDRFIGHREIETQLYNYKIPENMKKYFGYIGRKIHHNIFDKSYTELSIEIAKKIIGKPDKPFFLFMNLLECHLPYYPSRKILKNNGLNISKKYYNNWTQRVTRQLIDKNEYSENEFRLLVKLYDASINSLDNGISSLLNYLKNRNLLQNSLVVIVSDHGENIGDHGLIEHQYSLHDTLLHVPLIIKQPFHNKRTKNNNLTQTKDIFKILNNINNQKNTILDPTYQINFIKGSYCSPNKTHKNMINSYLGNKFTGKTQFIRTKNKKYLHNLKWNELYDIEKKEHLIQDSQASADLRYLLFN